MFYYNRQSIIIMIFWNLATIVLSKTWISSLKYGFFTKTHFSSLKHGKISKSERKLQSTEQAFSSIYVQNFRHSQILVKMNRKFNKHTIVHLQKLRYRYQLVLYLVFCYIYKFTIRLSYSKTRLANLPLIHSTKFHSIIQWKTWPFLSYIHIFWLNQ